jgi:hypothetical protein
MVHFVQQYSQIVVSRDAQKYVARVYASQQPNGRWAGWFVFVPLHGGRDLATDRETTQSSLSAVAYWATAISTTYLEGALERARALLPEARLARTAQQAEREEELARAEAAAYAEAAAVARLEALEAKQRHRKAEELLMAERSESARSAADLHERAAAAARAEVREAERRRRQAERQARAERRYASNAAGQRAARAANHTPKRRASRNRKKRP